MDNLIDLTGYDSSDDEDQDSPVLLKSPVVLSDLAELEEALSSPITSKNVEGTVVKQDLSAPPKTPHPTRDSLINKLDLSGTHSPRQPTLNAGPGPPSPVTPAGSRKLQPTASPFTPSTLFPRPREVSDSTVASIPSDATSLEGSIFTPTVVSGTAVSPTSSTDHDVEGSFVTSTPFTVKLEFSPRPQVSSLEPATPMQRLQRLPAAETTPTRKYKPTQLDLNMSELVLQPGYGSSVPPSPVKAETTLDAADETPRLTPASRDGQGSETPTSRPLSPISRLTASMRAFSLEMNHAEGQNEPGAPRFDAQNREVTPAKDDVGDGDQSRSSKERMAGGDAHDAEGVEASEGTSQEPQSNDRPQASVAELLKAMLEGVGEEAGVLDKLWERLKDEVYQFSAGIEEVVARLQGLSGGPSPNEVISPVQSKVEAAPSLTDDAGNAEAKTRPELEARCLVLSAELRSALERRVECEVRLAKVTRDRQRLRDKEMIWERQKAMFEQKYFELEDRLADFGSEPQASSTKQFAVVLLEGTSKRVWHFGFYRFPDTDDPQFPPKLIEKAFEGGELASESILDTVKSKLNEMSNQRGQSTSSSKVVLIQVQLDIIAMMNEYEDRGYTFKMSEIKKFLDGFASISAHVNVIDGPDPSSKLKAQADFWLGVQECVAVVLALSDPIDEAKLDASDKLFIMGEGGDSARGWIISPPVLFRNDGATKKPGLNIKGAAQRPIARDVSPASSVRTDYSRPNPTNTPRPVAPASPARTVDLLRARPLVSPPTEARGRKPSPPQSPVKKQKKLAPWAGGNATTAPKAMLQVPTPIVASGGSLLDRYHATQTQSTAGVTDREGSPTPTKPPHRPLKDRFTGRTSIVVPFAHGEEPSASPPDSDEDSPSVHLPHSAVKHVQRPITINRDSGSASPVSVASSSVTSSRQGGGAWRQTFSTMSRAVSGSNSTPLESRQPSQLAGRIHGFKVHRP